MDISIWAGPLSKWARFNMQAKELEMNIWNVWRYFHATFRGVHYLIINDIS